MKNLLGKIKSIEYLDKLPTKRLLSYYKARRKDGIVFVAKHTCECCGQVDWELYRNDDDSKESKKIYDTIELHLNDVKNLLNKKEHVKR